MNKKLLVLGTLVLAGAAAVGQTSIGTMANVQGLVTVSGDGAVGSAVTGNPIVDGTQFVTSSAGSVTLQMNNGCAVSLQPNQTVTVHQNMTCADLQAAVQPVGPTGGAVAGGGGTLLPAAVLGAGALIMTQQQQNLSNH